MCIGLPAGAYLRAPVFESVLKMVTIKGSYVGNRLDGAEAIEFYRRGLIKAPFKVIPMSELQKVYGTSALLQTSYVPVPFLYDQILRKIHEWLIKNWLSREKIVIQATLPFFQRTYTDCLQISCTRAPLLVVTLLTPASRLQLDIAGNQEVKAFGSFDQNFMYINSKSNGRLSHHFCILSSPNMSRETVCAHWLEKIAKRT